MTDEKFNVSKFWARAKEIMLKTAGQWRKSRWWLRFPKRRTLLTYTLLRLWNWVERVWPALALLAVLVVVLSLLRKAYIGFDTIDQGIYIEAWGTVFDIFVVGIIFYLFTLHRDRKERIERYLEEIGDFKKWDSEEARLRIAGNIRRLARLGKTDIDFSGLVLRNFSFDNHDIKSLKGATFSHGLHFVSSMNDSELENVNFSYVDCSGVTFSESFGSFGEIPVAGLAGKNLSFVKADLTDARFDGAKLTWTDYNVNEDDWYEDDEDGYGRPVRFQIHYPAFHDADLKDCSFRYTKLDHADFRQATNILGADFKGAEGLETCFFDDEVREQVLASAAKKPVAN